MSKSRWGRLWCLLCRVFLVLCPASKKPYPLTVVRCSAKSLNPSLAGGVDRVAAQRRKAFTMKANLHPKYDEVTATCSCGNVIKTRSTLGTDFQVDVCSECHPFYTGKQKIVDTGGRIDRFKKRFGSRIAAK